ncbi:T9SS type A sorting domain-containing protein [Marivirga salinae]|uniref:T9SS type A sorting domain-containing protein n=1 Tax=Marivirga salinarum TaxID=3059078 RepID=A0AA51ND59_9BACT|nr:T9SS type A sorting domain-containing protein [Marivirga sp. BDSF4-3]WMN11425.1 T9SS type A sorting domain-containing protein [Marivirga sp. BDSF4-3]
MSFSPKPTIPLLFILFSVFNLQAQNAWINEFHYDNESTDEGEFVEVVIEDESSYNLSLFTLLLYNGSDGETYGSSHTLDTFTKGGTENGVTIFYKDISGIQNGDDAFSLDYNGDLIQFISYEGAFTGVGGPADGELSTDIGVEETTSTPMGQSLQLSGNATDYSNFTWEGPAIETKGQLNYGQSFGAACTDPSTQAIFSTPSETDIEDNQINLSWSRGDGDGVLVLAKEGGVVNEIPQNGVNYNADENLSNGLADEIGTGNFVVYDGTANSINISGLARGVEYHFAIFEYLTTDKCYLTESETISVTTTTSLDEDSEINIPSTQIPSSEISSTANSETDAVEVFKFDISDKGSEDGMATLVNTILIEKSADNGVVDWSTVIKGAKLNDGNSDLTITDLSINKDNIEFDLKENEYSIADGRTETLILSIWLNETQTDGDIVGFEIPENHSFGTDVSGSAFVNPISIPITSNVFEENVVATQLNVTSTAQEYFIEDNFSISVSALDANNNIDHSARKVNISANGTGTLSGVLQKDLIDGKIEFDSLRYNVSEELIVTVDDGVLSEQIMINFIEPQINIDSAGFKPDFGIISFPNKSDYQSYQLLANNLKDTLFIKAPEGFQISLNAEFSNQNDSLIIISDKAIQEEIFVRFSPNSTVGESYQGNILNISQDADTTFLAVSGLEGTLNLSSITSARNKSIGDRVKIKGVVIGGNNHFESKRIIQDETAGIAIEGLNSTDINFGDSVEVEGVLSEEAGWLSLIPEKEINILSSDSIVIDPILKAIAEIDASVESQQVKIENLDILGEGQFSEGEYYVIDENSDSLIFKLNRDNHPLVGMEIPIGKVNVTGFIGIKNDTFHIYPEFIQNLEIIPRDTILIIDAPEEGLSFGSILLDEFSESKRYSLKAENLPENLRVTTSDNFEISLLENGDYANEIELPINEIGDIPEIEVYVRFSPISARGGQVSGEIIHISGGQKQLVKLNGIEEMITLNYSILERKILIYPNPVGLKLNIELIESGDFQFQLMDIGGKILIEGELMNGKTLKLDDLKKGIYLLKISDGTVDYHQRIIKK